MIVELSLSVERLSDQIHNNDRDRNRLADLNETRDEFFKTKQQASTFARVFGLLQRILGEVNNVQVRNQVRDLIKSLHDSQKDFSKNPRQVPIARTTTTSLTSLVNDISAAWLSFAENRLKPAFNLFDMLRNLPEFKSIQDALLIYKTKLEYFTSHVPKEEKELSDFEQMATNFSQKLTSIPGLTPQVQSFLAKIMQHTATLADLDDEILAWCCKPGRGKAFMVTFKN